MKTYSFGKLIIFCTVLIILFAWTFDSVAEENQTIKLAHIWSPESLQQKTHRLFGDIVEKGTNNKVKVKVYPAGQLGGWKDILEGEKSGMTHGIFISSDVLGLSTPIGPLGLWPYLFDTKEEFQKAYRGDAGKDYLIQLEKDTGYMVLAPTYKGARHMFSRKPIRSLKDLDGFKIRTPGLKVSMETWKLLGANPVPMGAIEAFTALQQGVISGVEQELQGGYDLGYHEAAKYIILSRHAMEDFSWIFWAKWFNGFSEETQKIIKKAAHESARWFEEEQIKMEDEMIGKLEKAGCTIIEPDVSQFKEALKPLKDKVPALWPWAVRLKEAAKN